MILRKPYAFLIRHFRLIHFLLFLVCGYILYRTNELLRYVNTFASTLIYSFPISMYITDIIYVGMWVLMIGFAIITYLLYYKKKPFIEYVIGIGIYILIYILFILINNYFVNLGTMPDVRLIRALRDFLTIAYIVQYVVVFYLLIKFMGLDLKKFGFKEDKDILAEDADEEEVEVALEFDKDKYLRMIKKRLRFLKYYLIEYKRLFIPIGAAIVVIVGIILLLGRETTRTYNMGEEFTGNNFGFRINEAYLTDRTYNGTKINNNGTRKYLIVSIDLMNFDKTARRLNLETFNLLTDTSVYHNSYNMYSYFEDLGSRYNDNYLESGVLHKYILLYEIESIDFGKDFYISYSTSGFRTTTRKVKLEIQDLTNYGDYMTVKKDEEMDINFYSGLDVKLRFIVYDFRNEVSYYYDGCKGPSNCGTYMNTTQAMPGRNILNLKYISNDIDGYDFSKILSKHGELVYKVGDETKSVSLVSPVHIKYKGTFLYFNATEEIKNSKYLEIKIVVRDKVYHYILKDEGEENEL